jgi:hypothetical protein
MFDLNAIFIIKSVIVLGLAILACFGNYKARKFDTKLRSIGIIIELKYLTKDQKIDRIKQEL